MKKFLFSALIGITALTIVGGSVALASEMGFGFGKDQVNDTKAELLGLTAEELDSQLETKTFPELLDEQGVTHVEMHDAMQANRLENATAKLQTQVDEEKITQDQMDERLKDIANGEGKGMRGQGGHGMHRLMHDENGDGMCDKLDQE